MTSNLFKFSLTTIGRKDASLDETDRNTSSIRLDIARPLAFEQYGAEVVISNVLRPMTCEPLIRSFLILSIAHPLFDWPNNPTVESSVSCQPRCVLREQGHESRANAPPILLEGHI